jgi:DNA-binding transcriptional MerR regulator
MGRYTIKDLADFSGLKKHTIRIWEQRFSFLRPQRTDGLRRYYTTEELNLLLKISLLNQNGYKVSRIAKMILEENALLNAQIASELNNPPKAINDLIICMAEMNPEKFEIVLDQCIYAWGIHETISHIIIPFSERIGLLDKLDQKNYLENIQLIKPIIKQKIYTGIDKILPERVIQKSVLLFLPPGENQELALLYVNYLLRKAGFKTIYVGPGIEIESLNLILDYVNPDYLVTHWIQRNLQDDLLKFLRNTSTSRPAMKSIVVGSSSRIDAKNENLIMANHPKEVINLMEIS